MELALTDLFRAKWTDEIHDEWIGSLLEARPELAEPLKRTRQLMNDNVRDCIVTDYEDLISGLELPDPRDRHVLAAAIRASADSIVTFNLKDFPASALAKYDIEALHPDDFIVHQMGISQPTVISAAKRHRARLQNPVISPDKYLATLEGQKLPQTVAILRGYAELI